MLHIWQAVFYILAIILIGLAGVGLIPTRLAVLGSAIGLLAFALPTIVTP